MSDLSTQRRYFAEELGAICDLRTPRLVDAFARVPREDYLTPGPWLVRSESDYLTGPPRQTADGDVRRLYHNVAVAIDPSRLLFNGAPCCRVAAWCCHSRLRCRRWGQSAEARYCRSPGARPTSKPDS